MGHERLARAALRLGAAFAFLYPPLAALADPVPWLSYFPHFIRTAPINPLILLHGFGALEIALALWVLVGRTVRIPAAMMTFLLVAIVAFNPGEFDVVFRDLSIAALTLALALSPESEEIPLSAPPARPS